MAVKPRERYIDALRAAALVRVVTYHAFPWIVLPYLFPSMGIMFALAGSLMAASLDAAAGRAVGVVYRRLRRLLIPLWAMGLVLVPVMLAIGWTADDFGVPLSVSSLWLWVVPIADPPGSDWGSFAGVGSLWYLVTYLWLVLLSPALYWAFKRQPIVTTLAVPVVGWMLSSSLLGSQAVQDAGAGDSILRLSDVLNTIAVYGGCWMLGFARHTGLLRRLSLAVVIPISLLLMTLGTAYAYANPHPSDGVAIDVIAPAQTLYCFGAVLLLLRFNPSFEWLARFPIMDRIVTAINARAVSIYLWNSAAVLIAGSIVTELYGHVPEALEPIVADPLFFLLTWLILLAAVLALGWLEDLAARRAPHFIPPALIGPPPRRRRSGKRPMTFGRADA